MYKLFKSHFSAVEITSSESDYDETVLKIKKVGEEDTGLYACFVEFKNKTDAVKFSDDSEAVQQTVVGEGKYLINNLLDVMEIKHRV